MCLYVFMWLKCRNSATDNRELVKLRLVLSSFDYPAPSFVSPLTWLVTQRWSRMVESASKECWKRDRKEMGLNVNVVKDHVCVSKTGEGIFSLQLINSSKCKRGKRNKDIASAIVRAHNTGTPPICCIPTEEVLNKVSMKHTGKTTTR